MVRLVSAADRSEGETCSVEVWFSRRTSPLELLASIRVSLSVILCMYRRTGRISTRMAVCSRVSSRAAARQGVSDTEGLEPAAERALPRQLYRRSCSWSRAGCTTGCAARDLSAAHPCMWRAARPGAATADPQALARCYSIRDYPLKTRQHIKSWYTAHCQLVEPGGPSYARNRADTLFVPANPPYERASARGAFRHALRYMIHFALCCGVGSIWVKSQHDGLAADLLKRFRSRYLLSECFRTLPPEHGRPYVHCTPSDVQKMARASADGAEMLKRGFREGQLPAAKSRHQTGSARRDLDGRDQRRGRYPLVNSTVYK